MCGNPISIPGKKLRRLLILPWFFMVGIGLWGAQEERSPWVLQLTALDTASLQESQRYLGTVIMRELRSYLSELSERERSAEELQRYQRKLQQEKIQQLAKEIAGKRSERDALLFKGLGPSKYEEERKKIDQALAELQKNLAAAQEAFPLPANPVPLKVLPAGTEDTFPPMPKEGERRSYCKEKKVDALLGGSLQSFYGRWKLSLFIYSALEDRIIYEDVIAFATEDQEGALQAVVYELWRLLSGKDLGVLEIQVEPRDASVIVDGIPFPSGSRLVGPPGTLNLLFRAPGYYPYSLSVDRTSGALTRVALSLKPLSLQALSVETSPEQSRVYLGGLYVGSTPLALTLAPGALEAIQLVSPDGREQTLGTRLEYDRPGPQGISWHFTPEKKDPPSVEVTRKRFYQAFGRFWLALPVAFLLNGIYQNYVIAVEYQGLYNLLGDAQRTYYVSAGAWVVTGIFLAESLYHLNKYIDGVTQRTVPLVESR
ncbi:MAG TPA: PEGA domain-containing protein [Termitinemataceae bacterium]|nr:PEGA domain-containing protein [Termitinemataceae bacterium]HOM22586.1 PEGA domain-containing protein [Termitinemataceae bacterium]HPQ00058.1 PEGA domain-containing protein [Termitinemataceae bacterium]